MALRRTSVGSADKADFRRATRGTLTMADTKRGGSRLRLFLPQIGNALVPICLVNTEIELAAIMWCQADIFLNERGDFGVSLSFSLCHRAVSVAMSAR